MVEQSFVVIPGSGPRARRGSVRLVLALAMACLLLATQFLLAAHTHLGVPPPHGALSAGTHEAVPALLSLDAHLDGPCVICWASQGVHAQILVGHDGTVRCASERRPARPRRCLPVRTARPDRPRGPPAA